MEFLLAGWKPLGPPSSPLCFWPPSVRQAAHRARSPSSPEPPAHPQRRRGGRRVRSGGGGGAEGWRTAGGGRRAGGGPRLAAVTWRVSRVRRAGPGAVNRRRGRLREATAAARASAAVAAAPARSQAAGPGSWLRGSVSADGRPGHGGSDLGGGRAGRGPSAPPARPRRGPEASPGMGGEKAGDPRAAPAGRAGVAAHKHLKVVGERKAKKQPQRGSPAPTPTLTRKQVPAGPLS